MASFAETCGTKDSNPCTGNPLERNHENAKHKQALQKEDCSQKPP